MLMALNDSLSRDALIDRLADAMARIAAADPQGQCHRAALLARGFTPGDLDRFGDEAKSRAVQRYGSDPLRIGFARIIENPPKDIEVFIFGALVPLAPGGARMLHAASLGGPLAAFLACQHVQCRHGTITEGDLITVMGTDGAAQIRVGPREGDSYSYSICWKTP